MTLRYIYLTLVDVIEMVSHINFAVDDDLAERGKEVKDARGWTWEEFFEAATEEFENGGDE